jgi:hypothetical protein
MECSKAQDLGVKLWDFDILWVSIGHDFETQIVFMYDFCVEFVNALGDIKEQIFLYLVMRVI